MLHRLRSWYTAIAHPSQSSVSSEPKSGLALQGLLIIPFVLQIAIAVGLVGYFSFRNSQQAVQNLAFQLRKELSNRIQQELDSYFQIPHAVNRINAVAYRRGNIDVLNATDGEDILAEQVAIYPTITFTYCSHEQDGSFFGVLRSPETNELQLSYGNSSNNFLREYYDLDTQGRRNSFLYQRDDPYDARQRPWYDAALRNNGPAWTDVYLAFTSGLPNITASLPVYDVDNELLGVCATDVFLPEEFRTFLQNLDIGDQGEAFVINRDGKLISSSTDEPLIQNSNNDDPTFVFAVASKNRLVQTSSQALLETFGDFEQIQGIEQLEFYLAGERQFLQVLPFQDEYGLDWLIIVVVPESNFMAEIHANTRYTILLCFIALAIAIGVGILTAKGIARPILRLDASTQAIAAGRLDETVEPSGITELSRLGTSFNRMAKQLNQAFADLETINQDLEQRVAQRTSELESANQEIQALNSQLQADNLRMGAELDVARKLQQMILPKEDELEGIEELEIAGFMEAADEVGGDYYDILRSSHHVRVGIGDVTGHGLESGVLMIMAQTAVRTLQALNERDPVKSLCALNQVIYENTQRMKSDKNLTLSLLDYRDGILYISGQHEEAILVRTTGEVERIDTLDLGFPIGLVEDISEFIAQHQTYLNPGDVVVVYTDGITEAENKLRKFYGLDRLVNLVKNYGHASAQTIREVVVNDLRSHIGDHIIYDDITLVVLKRK